MNASSKNSPKAWLQELKTNRRTQVALGASALVLIYVFWPSSPKARRMSARNQSSGLYMGGRQLQALRTLPDLASLGQAGELPTEERVFRDLFLFDAPLPPPPPPKPLPPPPPPTPEQIAEQQRQAAKNAEMNSRPQDLRYLGFMESASAGRLGAFMKGEEPVTLKSGGQANANWRLVQITDKFAEFQNLKYTDLRHRLEVREASSTTGRAISNEF